jgi:hypothetical protein
VKYELGLTADQLLNMSDEDRGCALISLYAADEASTLGPPVGGFNQASMAAALRRAADSSTDDPFLSAVESAYRRLAVGDAAGAGRLFGNWLRASAGHKRLANFKFAEIERLQNARQRGGIESGKSRRWNDDTKAKKIRKRADQLRSAGKPERALAGIIQFEGIASAKYSREVLKKRT